MIEVYSPTESNLYFSLACPVQSGQVLNLDRPWRERRDMLSGILTAASVVDRRKVVENLDRRFEQHAEIDDFEIASGLRKAAFQGFPGGGP